jgi:predicted peptidase
MEDDQMQSRRTFLGNALAVVVVGATSAACGSSASSSSSGQPAGRISATAITEVFGDGQKLTAVAVEYPKEIDTSWLASSAFTVTNRTVTKVYANTSPATARQGVDGRYVIVELSTSDGDASLWGTGQLQGSPAGGSAGDPKSPSSSQATPPGSGQGGPPQAGQAGPAPTIKPAIAIVTQAQAVVATDGATYPASTSSVTTSAVSNPIVDDFRQFTFTDTSTGQNLNYNLYTPRNHDKGKSYPLVLFMHDAGVVGGDTKAALVQGLGAVCWASPSDQTKRESFVLAPEYPTVVIDDNYRPTAFFDATVNLVKELTRQYSIDRNRLYATGQSMGAMMTLGMNIKYPDLFAASFVVAGQWPPAEVTPLARAKLWIVVSQGDDKAYPGENAITDIIAQHGTKVSRATWDGRSTTEGFATDVQKLQADDRPVNYASFVKGSVLPPGSSESSEHRYTWQVAYTIDGIRDWIFQQHK